MRQSNVAGGGGEGLSVAFSRRLQIEPGGMNAQ